MTGPLPSCLATENVEHPRHYTSHPSGIECIQITEHLSFCIGNAFKYLWRANLKGGPQDLEKSIWYLRRALTTEPRRRIRRTEAMVKACWRVNVAEPKNKDGTNSALAIFANLLALDIKTRTVLLVVLGAVEGQARAAGIPVKGVAP